MNQVTLLTGDEREAEKAGGHMVMDQIISIELTERVSAGRGTAAASVAGPGSNRHATSRRASKKDLEAAPQT